MASDYKFKNIYFLSLITTGYIIGEIAHFLIATTSKVWTWDTGSVWALAFTVQNINVCVSVGSSQLSGVWRPSLCHKRWCCWWWCGVWWLWIRRLVLRSQLHLWLGLQWPGDAVPDSCWSSLHLHLLRSCSHLWHPPGQVQQTNHHGDRWHLLLGSCCIVYLLYRRCTFVLCFLCCHGFCSRLLAAGGAQVELILNILYLYLVV